MSKTCKNCGNVFDDNMNICPRCGVQYIEQPQYNQQAPNNYQQAPMQQYGQPQYQQNYAQPMYQQYPVNNQEMSVGQWVGTIILTTCFNLISLILLFVWAFSDGTPTAKKNYCRTMLIVEAIGIGLVILLIILLAAANVSIFGALANQYA